MASKPPTLAGLRVVVTGGAGFIGATLVRALLAADADVHVLAADPDRRPPPADPTSGRVRASRLDVLDPQTPPATIAEALAAAEAVVHLDYRPPPPGCPDPEAHETVTNLDGLERLLAELPATVRRLVFASSVTVYGPRPPVPVHEGADLAPTTAYGRMKQRSEERLAAWADRTRTRATTLRLGTVYGAGETVPRAIPNFIRAALAGRPPTIDGSGEDVRDYVHVRDVCRGFVEALARDEPDALTYNLASGTGRTTSQVADRVVRLTGSDRPPVHRPRADEVPSRIVCDLSRARADLRYRPAIRFVTGLRDEVAWFTRRPELWTTSETDPALAPTSS